MRYTIYVCLLVYATLVCANRDDLWREWKRVHGKTYNDASESVRRAQWERSVDEIQEHNLRHDLGLETYTMGLNQFSDLSWEEFEQMYLHGLLFTSANQGGRSRLFVANTNDEVPKNLDWRKKGIVTPVKDQGPCGSCWAFADVGALESQYKKEYNETKLFSEQQLIDCSPSRGNDGCHGGSTYAAFHYLQEQALEMEQVYPYMARVGKCQYDEKQGQIKVSLYHMVHSGNENSLRDMVAQYGPAVVNIDADKGFKSYKSGIYTSRSCTYFMLNHAMLNVGYGTESGIDYWIVKNSWGSTWGEQGYIRMARNRRNMCGIATFAIVPVIAKV